jgi:Rap1a immunity proteins
MFPRNRSPRKAPHRLGQTPRAALLALFAVAGFAVTAAAIEQPLSADSVNLTGEAFLNALSSSNQAEVEKAGIYLLGVSETGEGKAWCDHKSFKTITVKEFVFEYFKKQPAARLREKAAPLIEEALRVTFPCRRSK